MFPRVDHGSDDEVGGQQRRAGHESMAQVRLSRPATTRGPRRRSTRARRAHVALRRYPAAARSATVVHAIAPGEGHRDRDLRGGHEHREREAAGRCGESRQPLEAKEPEQAEPRDHRVRDDERPHRDGGGELGEQAHREQVQPPALRVGREPVAGHLEGVPQRHVPGGDRSAEEREAREPEREDVGVTRPSAGQRTRSLAGRTAPRRR